jgi:vacuolar protein 8
MSLFYKTMNAKLSRICCNIWKVRHLHGATRSLMICTVDRNEDVFFEEEPLRALTTLSYSDNVDLQRSASLAFAEITERHVDEVDTNVFEPLLYLLKTSNDVEVQRASSAALGNLAVNVANKLKIVRLGGLEPLIKQMMSSNVEVQCNAVGCITNLATHEENKTAIARSGALIPLTKLARITKDIRVQRNATGALLNMTHSEENRRELVEAHAIPVLISLLKSADVDVVYYCTTALSNLAVDVANRKRLAQEPKLVAELVDLMESPAIKIQGQAALALRNLASDEQYQLEIVKHPHSLKRLLALMQGRPSATAIPVTSSAASTASSTASGPQQLQLILAAVACIRNISIHPQNEGKIIEAGFMKPLVQLLEHESEEIQCHSISTIRNLAAGAGVLGDQPMDVNTLKDNKDDILQSGALEKMQSLIRRATTTRVSANGQLGLGWAVLSEMTACLAVLALSDQIKFKMLSAGMVKDMMPLTRIHIPSDVQGNAAAALGNLATKAPDMAPFVAEWDGICTYLERFLEPIPANGTHYHERDEAAATFQHIAIWTLLQFCEGGEDMRTRLLKRPHLIRLLHQLEIISQDEEVEELSHRVKIHLGISSSTEPQS